jgi:hypothetical protein
MIDAKIAKAKALIAERERIDCELRELFGETALPRRGRPPKDRTSEAQASALTEPPAGE